MSALELQAEVLERLGAGDEVFVAEKLKQKAAEVAGAIAAQADAQPEGTIEERVYMLLEPAETPAEELLAVLLPVVEYAGPTARDALPRALVHISRQTSLSETQSSLPFLAGTLVVGRLAWAVAAYAVHSGRLDALTSAWRAALPSRYEDQTTMPLLAHSSLRHPEVFDRHAGKAYEDYRTWLEGRELIGARYPLFAAELGEAFAEADFLLALRAAAATGWEVYSDGFSRATVARLVARLSDTGQRDQLARLFGVADTELDARLVEAYPRLRADRHSWERPPAELFPAS